MTQIYCDPLKIFSKKAHSQIFLGWTLLNDKARRRVMAQLNCIPIPSLPVHGWQTGDAVGEGSATQRPHIVGGFGVMMPQRKHGEGVGSALSELVHAPLVPPFSLTPPPYPSSPPSTQCCEHRGCGLARGKQLCLAAINPRDVIHELLTINSVSVCKCG